MLIRYSTPRHAWASLRAALRVNLRKSHSPAAPGQIGISVKYWASWSSKPPMSIGWLRPDGWLADALARRKQPIRRRTNRLGLNSCLQGGFDYDRVLTLRGVRTHAPKAGRSTLLSAALFGTLSIAAQGSDAFAADAADQTQPSGSGGQLEEITVSARRRLEPLQEVPVAVSVITWHAGGRPQSQRCPRYQRRGPDRRISHRRVRTRTAIFSFAG